ncbi:hypothetical protein BLX87_01745, partial [Bacillus sp. VT-16-64]
TVAVDYFAYSFFFLFFGTPRAPPFLPSPPLLLSFGVLLFFLFFAQIGRVARGGFFWCFFV